MACRLALRPRICRPSASTSHRHVHLVFCRSRNEMEFRILPEMITCFVCFLLRLCEFCLCFTPDPCQPFSLRFTERCFYVSSGERRNVFVTFHTQAHGVLNLGARLFLTFQDTFRLRCRQCFYYVSRAVRLLGPNKHVKLH